MPAAHGKNGEEGNGVRHRFCCPDFVAQRFIFVLPLPLGEGGVRVLSSSVPRRKAPSPGLRPASPRGRGKIDCARLVGNRPCRPPMPRRAFLRSSCPGRKPGGGERNPWRSTLHPQQKRPGGRFCDQAVPAGCRAVESGTLGVPLSTHSKTARRAFLRSSQYRGTGAGVERAGGTAFGSEKGHQLPLVVCCWGIWLLNCWAWALTPF